MSNTLINKFQCHADDIIFIFHTVSFRGKVRYSEVKAFLQKQPDLTVKYISIVTMDNRSLSLSGNHAIHARKYVSDEFQPM